VLCYSLTVDVPYEKAWKGFHDGADAPGKSRDRVPQIDYTPLKRLLYRQAAPPRAQYRPVVYCRSRFPSRSASLIVPPSRGGRLAGGRSRPPSYLP
jgi:hypothetical protein